MGQGFIHIGGVGKFFFGGKRGLLNLWFQGRFWDKNNVRAKLIVVSVKNRLLIPYPLTSILCDRVNKVFPLIQVSTGVNKYENASLRLVS